MAANYIFSKTLPSAFSRLFCRYRFPVQNQWFCTTRLTGSSSDDSTVSYLVNSCGLSPEAAIVASHKVKLQSLVKPDSVLALLREYEFSETQISTLVRRRPHILVADAKKTLVPKLEFFCSIGISRLDLARTLVYNPVILMRSLKNSIIPCYTFLKSMLLSDVQVVNILKHMSWIFGENLSKNVIPNIEHVRELGIPHSCIARLLTYYAHIVLRKPEWFSQLVGEVKEMGFDPQKLIFVEAMHALAGKETTWNRCQEAYRKWGWSDEDILDAFRSYPQCMIKSQKKIMETMDFLVNKMGWQSQTIAKYSHVLDYSLEKRIIPRCLVVRVLLLKGLMKEDELSMNSLIATPEKYFLTVFVSRYLNQVPQLLNVYQGKVDFQDV
ncbi:hypothetical protein ABKV19_018533 [Rosa sericea]